MTYEELKMLNRDNPPISLLNKAKEEYSNEIEFYRSLSRETKNPMWKGKITQRVKWVNQIDFRLSKINKLEEL